MSGLRARDLVKVFGEGETAVHALDGVDLDIDAGEMVAIMGPSGSGKSTLLHLLGALETPSSGEISLEGERYDGLGDAGLTRLRRDRIGFVFQAYNLVPTLTALENITLPSTLAGRRPDPTWLDTVIDTVGLRDRLTHRPSELSGGQQQRVAVARALAGRPQVIFGDEPTGNLDSRAGGEVLGFLRQAVDMMGQTVVMVTHDPIAAGYADSAVFLADGRVVAVMDDPTAERVLDQMKRLGS
jgi:putative ABC transport system ATP-binding protein